MSLLQVLAETSYCDDFNLIIDAVKFILNVIRFGIPLILIVMISIDLFKAMTSGDEKAQKDAQSKSIKRVIYAVVVFLVPTLVDLIIGLIPEIFSDVDDSQTVDFFECWDDTEDDTEEETN